MHNGSAAHSGMSVRMILDAVTSLVMLVAACVLVWIAMRQSSAYPRAARSALSLPAEPVSISGRPSVGHPEARVVLIQFSDFNCPACQRFANDIWPSFREKWIASARLEMVYSHFLITPEPSRRALAAEGASCAALQGRFWPMHDRLFAARGKLSTREIRHYATAVGLSLPIFDDCMNLAGAGARLVADDVGLANSIGVRRTPTFVVGRRTDQGQVQVTSILEGIPPDAVLQSAFEGATKLSR